jgi:hypothetical protein
MVAAMGEIAVQTDRGEIAVQTVSARNLPSYGAAPNCMLSDSSHGYLEENICLLCNRFFCACKLKSEYGQEDRRHCKLNYKYPIYPISVPPLDEE